MTYEDFKSQALADPSTSYWLRHALAQLEQRDPVDAANDAEILALIFRARANELLERSVEQVAASAASCGT